MERKDKNNPEGMSMAIWNSYPKYVESNYQNPMVCADILKKVVDK